MDINKSLRKSYDESKRIIQEAQKNNQLVLFVGAGASISSGMPSWSKALNQIGKRLGEEHIDYQKALELPQNYFDQRGKKEYTELMRKVFRYGDTLSTAEVHKLIMKFNTSTIITTNYDHLIEQAAEENAEVMQVISCDKDLPYRKSGKELIKMHGDFEHDNFVLKEDDYANYSSNFKLIENYIKSIIGSKVVLFIGYSFNDPDTKQIMSWVKNILKDDMQRAYLIDVDSDYDRNKELYYKNWGVNIIFARAWIKRCNKKDKSQLLNKSLRKMLQNSSSSLGAVYKDLKGFKDWNYVYNKYIAQTFVKHSVVLRNGILVSSNSKNNLLNEIFECDKNTKIENKEVAKQIQRILSHSDVIGYQKSNKGKTVKLSYNIKNDVSELLDFITSFDFKELRKIRRKNEITLNENNPKMYLLQASISYYLGEYITSYNYLRHASKYLYRQGLYSYYFISEVNRNYLGQYIINQNKYSNNTTTNEIVQHIKNEISNINLDRTLKTLPDLGNNNSFLSDISNFTIFNTLFQSIYGNSLKLEEEARKNYLFYFGQPAYVRLRSDVFEFLKYEIMNYFTLDETISNNEIYTMYIQSILASTTSKDKKDTLGNIKSNNIHSSGLNWFDLYVILKYMENGKVINDQFENYSLRWVEVEKDALNYLNKTVPNILNEKNEDILYWKLIALCGHIRLNNQITLRLLYSLRNKLTLRNLTLYDNLILVFIENAKKQDMLREIHVPYLKEILNQILITLLDKKVDSELSTFDSILYYFKKNNILYSDASMIQKLIDSDMNKIVVELYKISTSELKTLIQKVYRSRSIPTISYRNYDIYLQMALNGIITFSKEIETKYISYLQTKNKTAKEVNAYPNDVDIITSGLGNLYVSNKIIDKIKVKEVIDEYAIDYIKWMIDPENFDYQIFETKWLENFTPSFLKKISQNNELKGKIKKQFIKEYSQNNLDSNLLDIYFTYFAK